jgi:uncharacterized protein DUF4062
MIRTPDQRLRVFVSSTLDELASERAAVKAGIAQLRLTPVLFESGARPYPPRALYRAYLAQSDIFIGVYWQRYGWVATAASISGLEDEYNFSGEKPRLIYVKTPAQDRDPRLQALLDRIKAEDHVSYRKFSTADDLRELVTNDLALLLAERFTGGKAAQDGPVAPPARRRPLIGRARDLPDIETILRRDDVGLVTSPVRAAWARRARRTDRLRPRRRFCRRKHPRLACAAGRFGCRGVRGRRTARVTGSRQQADPRALPQHRATPTARDGCSERQSG